MEHILLTLFLCFVAFAAVGQAAYTCPRYESAEKLYASPLKSPRAAPLRNNADADLPELVMISGGLEDKAAPIQKDKGLRRAA